MCARVVVREREARVRIVEGSSGAGNAGGYRNKQRRSEKGGLAAFVGNGVRRSGQGVF
jgi:hypothetical protein